MADYSKKALYSRKEVKLFSVALNNAFIKDAVFDAAAAGGGVKDTGLDLPAGEVLSAQIQQGPAVLNGSIAVVKLQIGAAGSTLLNSTGLAGNNANTVVVDSKMQTLSAGGDLFLHITADAGNAADWENVTLEAKVLMLITPS